MKKRDYAMSARADSARLTGERILDAALAQFAQHPCDVIRVDDIATEAGVTVQTVLRRFGSKASVLVAMARRELDLVAAQRASGPSASIEATVRDLVLHYERYGHLIAKLYAEAPSVSGLSAVAADARAMHLAWCTHVFDPFLTHEDLGEARIARAQLVAVCDATTWRILRRDMELPPDEVERAIRGLIAGVIR